MNRSFRLGVYFFCLLFLTLSCVSNKSEETGGEGQFIKSNDSSTQVILPQGWKRADKGSLNDEADIEMENAFLGGYAIVISEWKEDFTDMNLTQYSKITRDSLTRPLTKIVTGEGKMVTVGANEGLQHEIEAEFKNLNLIYLHTAVETPKRYHQIVTWSTRSQWEKKEQIFQEITSSLTEIGS